MQEALELTGLFVFAISGALMAIRRDFDVIGLAILGVTTAVGGGLLRDVIARETPALVRPDTALYAVPAIVGALAVSVAWELDAYEPALGAVAAAAVFGVRLLALSRGWTAPRAWRREV